MSFLNLSSSDIRLTLGFVCYSLLVILSSYVSNIKSHQGFPGGVVVKNPPANAGETGPGPGRSHMPRSNWACTLEPVSHNYWARVSQILKPVHLEPVLHKRSHRNEKPCNKE